MSEIPDWKEGDEIWYGRANLIKDKVKWFRPDDSPQFYCFRSKNELINHLIKNLEKMRD